MQKRINRLGENEMREKILITALFVAGAGSLLAQETHWPVTLGLKVGVPVTDMLSASNTGWLNGSVPGNYSAHTPRYEFGVSGEFHLPYNIRFEVDGLFKRAGFDSASVSGANTLYRPTSFNDWEIPGLFKFNVLHKRYLPFVDAGAVYRHISTITQTTYGLEPFGLLDNNSSALVHRNTYGAVAGFGFTFKKGPVELTPEARYTRWANQSFNAVGLRTNLDQGDVLLGISF
jgi:hypothetical protein